MKIKKIMDVNKNKILYLNPEFKNIRIPINIFRKVILMFFLVVKVLANINKLPGIKNSCAFKK